jgi:hypothetical protein
MARLARNTAWKGTGNIIHSTQSLDFDTIVVDDFTALIHPLSELYVDVADDSRQLDLWDIYLDNDWWEDVNTICYRCRRRSSRGL